MSLIEKLPNEVLLDIFDLLTIKVRLLRGNDRVQLDMLSMSVR